MYFDFEDHRPDTPHPRAVAHPARADSAHDCCLPADRDCAHRVSEVAVRAGRRSGAPEGARGAAPQAGGVAQPSDVCLRAAEPAAAGAEAPEVPVGRDAQGTDARAAAESEERHAVLARQHPRPCRRSAQAVGDPAAAERHITVAAGGAERDAAPDRRPMRPSPATPIDRTTRPSTGRRRTC